MSPPAKPGAYLSELGHTYHVQGEQPGASVFLRNGHRVYHTYSTYGRGMDLLVAARTTPRLDAARPTGGLGWDPDLNQQEKDWTRHHDKYGEVLRESDACCHLGEDRG
ncbi:MAG: DUF899 domain-containing protein [Pseudomonadota bacterium]|nr:DUF899 domain-containing protein [Pseudomonadota bacterium]